MEVPDTLPARLYLLAYDAPTWATDRLAVRVLSQVYTAAAAAG